MHNLRRYGRAPFSVAVIHGGPGAPGSMAPVARELAARWGVLEPLQRAVSVEGQVQELREVLEKKADLPVTLVGSSWGAMLAYLVAARYPALVRKLVLVGSGVYEEWYAAHILETRLSRLTEPERQQANALMTTLNDPAVGEKNTPMARLGELFTRADAYDPLTLDTETLECQYELHQRVWQEAEHMRRSGGLLEMGKQIRCRVVALHGDYDPHPPQGVEQPLARVLPDFRFILLEKCGHLPWIERQARDRFYEIISEELSQAPVEGSAAS